MEKEFASSRTRKTSIKPFVFDKRGNCLRAPVFDKSTDFDGSSNNPLRAWRACCICIRAVFFV
jgi:hypothetical protein